MELMICNKDDFDQIITNIKEFWGSDRTLRLHHPILVNEFGNTAFVLKRWIRYALIFLGFTPRQSQ